MTRTMHWPHLTRGGTLRPMHVKDTRPDWLKGLLLVLSLLLMLVVVQANEDVEAERVERARAQQREERMQQRMEDYESQPQVRLTGDGFTCRTSNIRKEWERAAAQKCQEFSAFLHMARATE